MNKNKVVILFSISLMLASSACSPSGADPVKSSVSPSSAATRASVPGEISIPADSPLRKQISLETVTEAVLPGDLVVAPGRIDFDPSRVNRIALPVPGRIESVLVRMGGRVAAGQPLFTIDSPDADAALAEFRQTKAAVSQAESALTKAQADRDRAAELFDHKAIAKKDLLAAENELVQAGAVLAQTEASLEHDRRRLEILGLNEGPGRQLVTVKAPLSGKVIDISMSTGEYKNDTNTPVMTVADLSVVWVASSVPENMIRFIEKGEEVQLELVAFPGEKFKARVMRISDTLDPRTRAVEVCAEMSNPEGRFKPEMYGTIRHSHVAESMPVIPAAAVIRKGGESLVYVERTPGSFFRQSVDVGQASGDKVPISRGLRVGDRVVVDGVMLLSGMEDR